MARKKKTETKTEETSGRVRTLEDLKREIALREGLLGLKDGQYVDFSVEEVGNVGQFRARLKRITLAENVWFLAVGRRFKDGSVAPQRVYRLGIDYPRDFLAGEDE